MRRILLFTIVTLVATGALAQTGGMQPVVAPNGTVLVTRPILGTDYRMSNELIAISADGVQLWKWNGGAAMHAVSVAGTRVLASRYGSAGAGGSVTQEVVALSLATGAEEWRRAISGSIMAIEPSGDRVYVVSGGMGGMMGGMSMRGSLGRPTFGESKLTALNAATGDVLWTVTLK